MIKTYGLATVGDNGLNLQEYLPLMTLEQAEKVRDMSPVQVVVVNRASV